MLCTDDWWVLHSLKKIIMGRGMDLWMEMQIDNWAKRHGMAPRAAHAVRDAPLGPCADAQMAVARAIGPMNLRVYALKKRTKVA